MARVIAYLIARPALLAGTVSAMFVLFLGMFIGTNLANRTESKVSWFTPTVVAALVIGSVVALVAEHPGS